MTFVTRGKFGVFLELRNFGNCRSVASHFPLEKQRMNLTGKKRSHLGRPLAEEQSREELGESWIAE
jgi:hypothetical protein